MKCQTINCVEEATHEVFNMHHTFAVTVHCREHGDGILRFMHDNNMCGVMKPISPDN